MKKLISLFICLSLLAAALSSCGGNSGEGSSSAADSSAQSVESTNEKSAFEDFYKGIPDGYASELAEFRAREHIPAPQNAESLTVVRRNFDYKTIRAFADVISAEAIENGFLSKSIPAEELDDTSGTSEERFAQNGSFCFYGEKIDDDFYVGDDPREVAVEASGDGIVRVFVDYSLFELNAFTRNFASDKDGIDYSSELLTKYFPSVSLKNAAIAFSDGVCSISLADRTALSKDECPIGETAYSDFDVRLIFDRRSDGDSYLRYIEFYVGAETLSVGEREVIPVEAAWEKALSGEYISGSDKLSADALRRCSVIEWRLEYFDCDGILYPCFEFLVALDGNGTDSLTVLF